jgi:hypothetical protein
VLQPCQGHKRSRQVILKPSNPTSGSRLHFCLTLLASFYNSSLLFLSYFSLVLRFATHYPVLLRYYYNLPRRPPRKRMDEKIFFVLLAIVLFVFLGPLKISDLRVRNRERYQPNNLRYNTPGRNQRQRQLAQDREDRKMGQSQSQNTQEAHTAPQEPEIVEYPEEVAKRVEEVYFLPRDYASELFAHSMM